MTKDVLVSISGLQFEVNDDEVIEVVTPGQYYYKNNKHYVLYHEFIDSDANSLTNNTLKICKGHVDIIKRGASNVHMIFEIGKENMTYYETPFGTLLIGISTSSIDMTSGEDNMEVNIKYDLSINYTHISECDINLKITSNKNKDCD